LLLSYIGVAFLNDNPSSWPPLMDRPWASESLHEFWGARWHQTLRLPVLVLGGYPLQFIFRKLFRSRAASDVGLVVGAFVASGVIHHVGFYNTGRTPGLPTIVFFTAQSLGLGAERAWRALTGKRVGGWWGTLWVWSWIVVGGQPCSKSSLTRSYITAHLLGHYSS
jgi:Membrane bound O-acyl transferase family